MKLGLIAHLRRHRRPAVVLAAGLIAVQAFLAGLVMAQAALVLTPGLPDDAGFAVICHGNGGSPSDPGTAPDPAKSQHPCCVTCAAGAAPAAVPTQLIVLRADRPRLIEAAFFVPATIRIAPRAVRAGPSQAPPSRD
jgi:hypothetical protein